METNHIFIVIIIIVIKSIFWSTTLIWKKKTKNKQETELSVWFVFFRWASHVASIKFFPQTSIHSAQLVMQKVFVNNANSNWINEQWQAQKQQRIFARLPQLTHLLLNCVTIKQHVCNWPCLVLLVGFFVWYMFSFYSFTLHRFVHVKIVQKVRWHLAQLMTDNLILIKFIWVQ